jgi:hypothetical protein
MGDESNRWQRLEQACLDQADQCALPAARAAFEELAAKYRKLAERGDLAEELVSRPSRKKAQS